MHRSILTGLFVCILSAGLLAAVASAEPTGEPGAPAVATTSVTSASEAAAPTDGADLAMWNARPPKPTRRPTRSRRPAWLAPSTFRSSPAGSPRAAPRWRRTSPGTPCGFWASRTRSAARRRTVSTAPATSSTSSPWAACTCPAWRTSSITPARASRASRKAGDLVFFHTYAAGVSHVGHRAGRRQVRPRLVEPRRHGLEPPRLVLGPRATSAQSASSTSVERRSPWIPATTSS